MSTLALSHMSAGKSEGICRGQKYQDRCQAGHCLTCLQVSLKGSVGERNIRIDVNPGTVSHVCR